MAKKFEPKLAQVSRLILFWMIAIVAALTAVNYFYEGWGSLKYISPVLGFGMAVVVFVEVGYFSGFNKKDVFRIAGVLVALVAMLGVILELLGISVGILNNVKGLVSALLAVYFIVEGIR